MIDQFRTSGRGPPRGAGRAARRGAHQPGVGGAGALAEGLTTKQVAERLFLSPVTVRRHVSSTLAKLDVPDRAAAVELLEASFDRRA